MAEKLAVEAGVYLKDCLAAKGVRVSRIILFGSHARGTADGESDLDFIVVSEDFRGKGIFERAKMIGDSEFQVVSKFDAAVDLLLKTPEEVVDKASIIARHAAKDGIVVWAA